MMKENNEDAFYMGHLNLTEIYGHQRRDTRDTRLLKKRFMERFHRSPVEEEVEEEEE